MERCCRELNLEIVLTEVDGCLFNATRVYLPSFMTLKSVACIVGTRIICQHTLHIPVVSTKTSFKSDTKTSRNTESRAIAGTAGFRVHIQ